MRKYLSVATRSPQRLHEQLRSASFKASRVSAVSASGDYEYVVEIPAEMTVKQFTIETGISASRIRLYRKQGRY